MTSPYDINPEPRAKRFRKLRTAWSTAWGVVAVLLVVSWVLSYWQSLTVGFQTPDGGSSVATVRGNVAFTIVHIMGADRLFFQHAPAAWAAQKHPVLGVVHHNSYVVLNLPTWLFVCVAISLTAAPWIRWRFSLRTLLIATTLVAVGLGMIAWLR